MKSWHFPQYRKFSGVDVWYKISSLDEFTELKRAGGNYVAEEFVASQYPEKLRIQDMLNCHEDRWQHISEEEYKKVEWGLE